MSEQPQNSRVAVVIVDVQHDFLDETSARVASWEKAFCVPGIERLLEFARESGWLVVHVGTEHKDATTLPLHQQRRELELYCEAGSEGCEFVIPVPDGEEKLYKTWYSAFSA